MFWFFIELSSILFMFIYIKDINISSRIYFLITGITSIIFLIYLISNEVNMLILFFMIKLPVFPFLSWIYSVRLNLSMNALNIVLLAQKIPLLSLLIRKDTIGLEFLLLINLAACFFLCLKSNSFITRLVTNSVFSTGWILLTCIVCNDMIIIYFLLFCLDYLFIIIISSKLKNFSNRKNYNPAQFILLFSMIAVPPTPRFFIKIFILFRINRISFAIFSILLLTCNFLIQLMLLKHFIKFLNFKKSKPILFFKLLYVYIMAISFMI